MEGKGVATDPGRPVLAGVGEVMVHGVTPQQDDKPTLKPVSPRSRALYSRIELQHETTIGMPGSSMSNRE